MPAKKTATPVEKKTTKTPAAKSVKASAPKAAKEKAPAKKNVSAAAAKTPATHEEISRLAAQMWIENGHPHGTAEQDWLRAEHQLNSAD